MDSFKEAVIAHWGSLEAFEAYQAELRRGWAEDFGITTSEQRSVMLARMQQVIDENGGMKDGERICDVAARMGLEADDLWREAAEFAKLAVYGGNSVN
jgi:hypothetical protein